jgi:DNA-binding NarL/FixJ family response regulator
MFPTSEAPAKQRLRVGGPVRVLLVVDNAQLLLRMSEVARSFPGLSLVGAFTTGTDAVDWMVWDRQGCHLAFVDLGLRNDGANQVIARLAQEGRVGTVVAIGDHLWREIREKCAAMGVYHLLEKGDLIAFRGFLEEQLR